MHQSIVEGMIPYRNQIHTITYDNGLEFSEHQNIAQTLSANIYFVHPYSSWERGLNENTNGLTRQYLPKLWPLNNVTQKELDYIMDQLNHRPRKTLGFKTPCELFFNKKTLLTVALQSWIRRLSSALKIISNRDNSGGDKLVSTVFWNAIEY